jgi:magnesium-transporting ATPase (P-type)
MGHDDLVCALVLAVITFVMYGLAMYSYGCLSTELELKQNVEKVNAFRTVMTICFTLMMLFTGFIATWSINSWFRHHKITVEYIEKSNG